MLAVFVWNIFHNRDTQAILRAQLLFLILWDLVHSNGLNLPDTQRTIYSRDVLLQLGFNSDFTTATDSFPEEIFRKNSSNPGNSTHQKHKVTKRGKKKGGIKTRVKREACKQRPLPPVILANVCSLQNKLDELQANINHLHEYRTASILSFTETWLNNNDSDNTLHIDGFTPPNSELIGKQHGGSICLYVSSRCCTTVVVSEKLCNTDTELFAVSLHPFYLPREFPELFVILANVHPKQTLPSTNDVVRALSRTKETCSQHQRPCFKVLFLRYPQFIWKSTKSYAQIFVHNPTNIRQHEWSMRLCKAWSQRWRACYSQRKINILK